jgi:hypothetical protein
MSDLLLTLSVPRQQFAMGEVVLLTVKLRNQSARPIQVPNLEYGGAPGPVYIIKLPSGKKVIYDPLWLRPERRTQQDLPLDLVKYLGPGETILDDILPNHGVDLDQPGKYEVTARLKWREFDLESETVEFTLIENKFSDMVLSELPHDPETVRVVESNMDTWGDDGDTMVFQAFDEHSGKRLGEAGSEWFGGEDPDRFSEEWPISFGEQIEISNKKIPDGFRLTPVQTASLGNKQSDSANRLGWNEKEILCGWLRWVDDFYWFHIPSPKPISKGLRLLNTIIDNVELAEAFVVFQGDSAELGHAHITGHFKKSAEHTPLRPIAQLGPGFVAAQVMMGQPEMGSPIVLASLTTHPSGTEVTFLRIDGGKGAVVAKARRLIAGFTPLGPVAMSMRVRGAMVEAAFPVQAQNTEDSGALHVIRLAAPIDLQSVHEPIVSDPIEIEGPLPTMVINYSNFPVFFPNGVGLLLRQPGNRAFFWTVVRGLKRLPFTLHDRDEALIMGRRSSWYVLINDGSRLFAKTAESFFQEYRPLPKRDSP